MFIPNENLPQNKIGKEYTLKRDMKSVKGTITKGSRVIVVASGVRGYDIRDIESGEKLSECGYDIFEVDQNG
jgi:hypothetical protein